MESPSSTGIVVGLRRALRLSAEDSIGTLKAGRLADLVVIRGDPSTTIADIEKVQTVFKDGVGYDSARLIEFVKCLVGLR